MDRGSTDSPVIADVGTGAGLFLRQLAEVYPQATLRGFDISSAMYPTPQELPANVELHVMDVKQPPPPEEHHRYDVVHARLLFAAMTAVDWEVALHNMRLLLKPGGAIQWEEPNFAEVRHYRGVPGSSTSTLRIMSSRFRAAFKERLLYGWSSLPRLMKEAGLVHVDEEIVSSDRVPETRQALTTNGNVALFAWAKQMTSRGMPDSLSTDELEKLEALAEQEVKSGCYVRFDIHIITGFQRG
ncbi:MAG: hypothetical protein LQ352_008247 [Teloschistes flavicans]|nr:MAG: hypothetical protein LQ352_008247 [Teloschistes flavicans]